MDLKLPANNITISQRYKIGSKLEFVDFRSLACFFLKKLLIFNAFSKKFLFFGEEEREPDQDPK